MASRSIAPAECAHCMAAASAPMRQKETNGRDGRSGRSLECTAYAITAQIKLNEMGSPYIIDRIDNQTLWGCRACNWTLLTDSDEAILHACGKHHIRLGDKIESVLTGLGITQERWKAAKASIGLPPTCNCKSRIAWLNKLDNTLQLGDRLHGLKAALGWKDSKDG
jgi:hypothetical protein